MEHQDNATDACEVRQNAEVEEHESDDVVDEHLPEVFAFDVGELRDKERIVEGCLDCVVVEDVGCDLLLGIVYPVVVCVPDPFFLQTITRINELTLLTFVFWENKTSDVNRIGAEFNP